MPTDDRTTPLHRIEPRGSHALPGRDPASDVRDVPTRRIELDVDAVGATQTLEILRFATAVRGVFVDGVQATDILAAPSLVAAGIRAYRGADRVPAELAALSAEERESIGDELEQLLGGLLGGISQKIYPF